MALDHFQVGAHKLKYGRPTVVASVTQPVAIEELRTAQARGMDVAELRLDLFPDQDPAFLLDYVHEVAEAVPTLLTIRASSEGGKFTGSEDARLRMYTGLIPLVHAVDVELSAGIAADVLAEAKQSDRLSILSFHDFTRTPEENDLSLLVRRALELSNKAIFKVATKVQSDTDVRTLSWFLANHVDTSLIALGMGEHGVKTRIFFPALGSLATYAAFGDATAPGQLGLEETASLLQKFYPGYRQ